MRPAQAIIDLNALRHNYQVAQQASKNHALAVIKADAYGHGAVECARALESGADGFAVACIEEALTLREAGITKPILLLEGAFEEDELPLIAKHRLWLGVATMKQLEAIESTECDPPLHIWLIADSGMHRLGLDADQFQEAYHRLSALPHIAAIVLMTHMARADELDSTRTTEQAENFKQITQNLLGPVSLGNSATTLCWQDIRNDWTRPGLMLYGANPFYPETPEEVADLQAVMTLKSKIIATRQIDVGEPVGYGAQFVAERPTRVGVVAMGYADGYPQFAANGTPVLINGKRGKLIGRVSMDMLTVDLTDHPEAGIGSDVVLWGNSPSVSEVAAWCNMSAYQLLCNVKRVPLNYVSNLAAKKE